MTLGFTVLKICAAIKVRRSSLSATLMPATKARKSLNHFAFDPKTPFVLGVDGCKGGWVAAQRVINRPKVELSLWPTINALFNALGDARPVILIDMPIGLAQKDKRACEAMARAVLKPRRQASVFPSPLRPMLDFSSYEEANAYGKNLGPGFGLTKQTWMITPKIREIDAIITPDHQSHIGEGHPEVAFWRLNNETACLHPKRSEAGQKERLDILKAHGLTGLTQIFAAIKDKYGPQKLARDDIIDACALALSAEARLKGNATRLSDDTRDQRGLVMEIWG